MAATSNFTTGTAGQLIDGDGSFNTGIRKDIDYDIDIDKGLVGVVSIMGVQSSGKSTLMNKCFLTDFKEMKEELGMSQTTTGIWMSKLSFQDVGESGHNILLLDCEGSDGAERGKEGNDIFEKQVTLFALASSDVVIINMKCENVNLRNGASMPLIQNVFQAMVRKFTTPRRITLLFVLRDKNNAPLEKLEKLLARQLHEAWENMCKELSSPLPELEDYFKVEVKALPHYKYEKEAFMSEVVKLRERVFELIEKGRLSSAAKFISLAKQNWSDIQADNILNLVFNKKAVDEVFFNTMKKKIIQKFSQDKNWVELKMEVRVGVAEHFGDKVSSLIDTYLSEFDEETKSFNALSREDAKMQVTKRLLEVVHDTYLCFLENKRISALEKFQAEIDEKIEALDSNFDRDMNTKTCFQSLMEAKVKQANDWNEAYDIFEEAKSNIIRSIKEAGDIIKERKAMQAQAANKLPTDAEKLADRAGDIAIIVAKNRFPGFAGVLDSLKDEDTAKDAP